MDIILVKKSVSELDIDRELSVPRLQYIKMNCKDGQPASLSDFTLSNILSPYNMLFSAVVDAPQYHSNFGFGDGKAVATETSDKI